MAGPAGLASALYAHEFPGFTTLSCHLQFRSDALSLLGDIAGIKTSPSPTKEPIYIVILEQVATALKKLTSGISGVEPSQFLTSFEFGRLIDRIQENIGYYSYEVATTSLRNTLR